MADDPYNSLGVPPASKDVLGIPRTNYDPFGAAQMAPGGMGMQLALYAPQLMQMMFGISKFIPQQSPGQLLMDQMTSAKYMQDSMRAREYVRPQDQEEIFKRLDGMRAGLGFGPLTPLGSAQLNNFAGIINTDAGQAFLGSLFGAQNVEDAFFGRRGSAVQMANAVSKIGFYRPDSVTGGDRMSGKSLQQFTEQLYGNLYGPGANLNDISGFSAGRVGTLANDLARRGMLPQSIGSMPDSMKMEILRDETIRPKDFEESIARELADETFTLQGKKFGDKKYSELDRKSRQEILDETFADPERSAPFRRSAAQVSATMSDPEANFDDVLDLPGGASGVRKVDATRVSNTLKEYAGVVSAVRAIFGDNGMGNAPMSQLVAALDALAQGGMSSIKPGRLENIMRRTQMASRDSGVSMEALMGLTARGGALADQNGMVRDIVPEAVIQAMERGAAMRDTNAFRPGFGKMNADEAVLYSLDQTVRADASNAGRLLATANRIVAENEGNAEFNERAGVKDLKTAIQAMQKGASTFVNEAGETVNIAREMGQNPQQFFADLLSRAGVSDEEIEARYYDAINTQEYLIPGQVAAAQRYEAIQKTSSGFVEDFLRREKGQNIPEEQREELALSMGESAATAMIDEVDSADSGAERVQIIKRALRRGIEQEVRRTAAPGTSEADIQRRTKELFIGDSGVFKDDAEATSYAGMVQADIGRQFEAIAGNINKFRQVARLDVAVATEQRRRRNMAKAEMAAKIDVEGDGSNFIQRLSDALVDGGGADGIMAAALGTMDTVESQQKFIDAAGGKDTFTTATGAIAAEFSEATIDSDEERAAAMQRVFAGGSEEGGRTAFSTERRKQTFAEFKERFEGVPGAANLLDDYDTAISNEELAENIIDTGAESPEAQAARDIYKTRFGKKSTEVEAIFSDPILREQAIREVTKTKGFADLFSRQLEAYYAAEDLPEKLADIGLGGNVMTETEMDEILDMYKPTAGDDPATRAANEKKLASLNTIYSELGSGNIQAQTILDVMGDNITDPTQRENVRKAMQFSIDQFDDTVTDEDGNETSESLTKLSDVLESAGIKGEEQERMLAVVRTARAQRIMGGGFDDFGGTALEQKSVEQARLNAILTSELPGGELGELLTAYEEEKDPKKKEEAKAALAEAVKGTKEDFEEKLDKAGASAETKKTINEQIAKQAPEQETGSRRGGLVDGILGQVGDSVSAALTKAVGESFKDLKIENVTITNLNLNAANLLTSLFNGLGRATEKDTTGKDTEKADAKESTETAKTGKEAKETDPSRVASGRTESAQPTTVAETAQSGTAHSNIEQMLVAFKSVTAGITQAATGMGSNAQSGPTEITGTLRITGMNTAIASLTPQQVAQPPDGGAVIPLGPPVGVA
jgi:hypothetical protein